jgi:tetratricopeptide (TPR) repeat protein
MKRDLDRAIEYGESAMARAQTLITRSNVQHILGYALCYAGDTDKGIELLEGLRQLSRAVRVVVLELPITLYLAEGYWLAGEYDKGRQTAEDVLKLAEPIGARYEIGGAHFLLGQMAVETDPAQAATRFDESIAILQEIKAENALAMAYAGYGRLHKWQGRTEKAREYFKKSLDIFDRLGTLLEPDKVRKELAELPEQ